MKLKRGQVYDESKLVFAGWSNAEDNPSYSCWDYFVDGCYLGPDDYGIEPLFEPAMTKEQFQAKLVELCKQAGVKLEFLGYGEEWCFTGAYWNLLIDRQLEDAIDD